MRGRRRLSGWRVCPGGLRGWSDGVRRRMRWHVDRYDELRRLRTPLRAGLSLCWGSMRLSFGGGRMRRGLRGHCNRSRPLRRLRDHVPDGTGVQRRVVHVSMLRPERPMRRRVREPDGRSRQLRVLRRHVPDGDVVHQRRVRLRRPHPTLRCTLCRSVVGSRQLRSMRQCVRHGKLLPRCRLHLFALALLLRWLLRRHADGQCQLRVVRRGVRTDMPGGPVRVALSHLTHLPSVAPARRRGRSVCAHCTSPH